MAAAVQLKDLEQLSSHSILFIVDLNFKYKVEPSIHVLSTPGYRSTIMQTSPVNKLPCGCWGDAVGIWRSKSEVLSDFGERITRQLREGGGGGGGA